MIGLGVAAVAAIITWLLDRRRRRYADRATTPAAVLFAGFNLVKGRAWVAEPRDSYRTRTPSIWWKYVLEEERRHTRTVSDGKGNTRTETYTQWHTIDTRVDHVPECEVIDDTGTALVRVTGANVVPRQSHRDTFRKHDDRGLLARMLTSGNRTGRYRETEHVVGFGDDVFVAGECELDEQRLVPVVAKRVMLSTRSEESHIRWLTVGVVLALAVTLAATTLGVASLIRPGEVGQPVAWIPGLAAGLVLLAVAALITTYNRLCMVAQGADRAWSLIDVQLRRRHDLIPSLVECVRAHADHEQQALITATSARSAAASTDEAGAQTSALRQILAVAEAYPELTADDSFLRLQSELADTEDRIAASRSFYNDSLTILRDRQHRFPGMLVARWVPLEHRDLVDARGFERTVPSVEHSFAS